MFSPKAYVRDLIIHQLSDWVENISENSINLEILEGDLQLSNLVLKKKSWVISQGLSVSIELGSIDKFSVQIPWSTIHTGLVHVFIDQVSIVIRLNVHEHEQTQGVENKCNESFTQEMKMNKLAQEELKLLGHDGAGAESWLSKYMGSVARSMLTKIAAKFSLTATNIKLSVLLPHSTEDCALLKVNVGTIEVNHSAPSKNSGPGKGDSSDRGAGQEYRHDTSGHDTFLSKNVQMRGLSAKLLTVNKPVSARDYANTLKDRPVGKHSGSGATTGHQSSSDALSHIILNPCNASAQLIGRRGYSVPGSSGSSKGNSDMLNKIKVLVVSMTINNIDCTPTTTQLAMVKTSVEYLKEARLKYRFQSIRQLSRSSDRVGGNVAGQQATGDNSNIMGGMSSSSGSRKVPKVAVQQQFNPKELWRFAIRAVLIMIRERNCSASGSDGCDSNYQLHLRSGIARLALRRQYIQLYRAVMEVRLGLRKIDFSELEEGTTDGANAHTHLKSPDTASASTATPAVAGVAAKKYAPSGLTMAEQRLLDELHSSAVFTSKDLLLFRAAVHQDLQNKDGVTVLQLRAALLRKSVGTENSSSGSSNSYWNYYFGGGAAAKKSDSTASALESGAVTRAEPEEESGLLVEFDCALSRVALTIYETSIHHTVAPTAATNTAPFSKATLNNNNSNNTSNISKNGNRAAMKKKGGNVQFKSSEPEPPAMQTTVSLKQSFSVVLYGLYTQLQSASDSDRMVQVAIGAAKCYGHKGEEIVSWGELDPNEWLEDSFVRRAFQGNPELALSISMQWRQTVVPSADLASDMYLQWVAKNKAKRGDSASSEDLLSGEDAEDSAEESGGGTPKSRPRRLSVLDLDSAVEGGGTTNSTILQKLMKCSDRHIVVELSASHVHMHYSQRTCIFVTDLCNSLVPQAPPMIKSKPFAALKRKAAQLSIYQSMRGIFETSAKLSIETVAAGFSLHIPMVSHMHSSTPQVRESGKVKSATYQCLLFTVGRISVQAGDYLQNFIATVSPSPITSSDKVSPPISPTAAQQTEQPHADSPLYFDEEEEASSNAQQRRGRNDSMESLHSLEGTECAESKTAHSSATSSQAVTAGILKHLVVQLSNSFVRPVIFSVGGVELSFVTRKQGQSGKFFPAVVTDQKTNKRLLTTEPWSLCGALSLSTIPSSRLYVDTRVDLLCSPFKLALSTQDIIQIIDITNAIGSIFMPIVAEIRLQPVPPRIQRLAPLSVSFIDLSVELFEFVFLKDNRSVALSSLVRGILTGYGDLVLKRGHQSFVGVTKKDLALSQLANLGLSQKLSEGLVAELLSHIIEQGLSVASAVSDICDNLSDTIASEELLSVLTEGGADHKRIVRASECPDAIYGLVVRRINLVHHALTYDSKTALKLEDCLFYDADRNPLIRLNGTERDRLEEFRFLDTSPDQTDTIDSSGKHRCSGSGKKTRERSNSKHRRRKSSSNLAGESGDASSAKAEEAVEVPRISGVVNDDVYFDSFELHTPSTGSNARSNHGTGSSSPRSPTNSANGTAKPLPALVLQHSVHDYKEEFGQGGYDLSMLYSGTLSASNYALRESSLSVQFRQVDVLVSATSMLHILSEVIPSVSRVQTHHSNSQTLHRKQSFLRKSSMSSLRSPLGQQENSPFSAHFSRSSSGSPMPAVRGNHHPTSSVAGNGSHHSPFSHSPMSRQGDSSPMPTPHNKGNSAEYIHEYSTHATLTLGVAAVGLLLSVDNKYLSKISLYSVAGKVVDMHNCFSNRLVEASVQSLSMLDLSDLGALHSEVLWTQARKSCKVVPNPATDRHRQNMYGSSKHKSNAVRMSNAYAKRSAPALATPAVLTASLQHTVDPESKGVHLGINVEVTGLRACFHYRHLTELLDFFSQSLIAPLCAITAPLFETPVSAEPELDLSQSDSDSDSSYSSSSSRSSSGFSSDSSQGISVEGSVGDADDISEQQGVPHFGSPLPSSRLTGNKLFPSTGKRESAGAAKGALGRNLKVDVNAAPYVPSAATSAAPHQPPTTFALHIKVSNLSCVLPRNSNSRDLAAASVESAVVAILYVHEPWTVPTKDTAILCGGQDSIENANKYPLHFDLVSNSWRFEPSGSKDAAVTPLSEPDSGKLKKRMSVGKSRELRHSFSDLYGGGGDEDDDLFFDSVQGDFTAEERTPTPPPRYSPFRLTSPPPAAPVPRSGSSVANILRISVDLNNANVFVSFAGPLAYKKDAAGGPAAVQHMVDSNEHKLFLEVLDGQPVNEFRRKGPGQVGVWSANQCWHRATPTPLNLRMVLDFTDTMTKLLFCDTGVLSALHLSASQAEFYLILSIWFDNIHETPHFMHKAPPVASRQHMKNQQFAYGDEVGGGSVAGDSPSLPPSPMNSPMSPSSSNASPDKQVKILSHYGNKSFVGFLLNRESYSFELVVVRAEVRLTCSIDTNYFGRQIPSFKFLNDLEPQHHAAAATGGSTHDPKASTPAVHHKATSDTPVTPSKKVFNSKWSNKKLAIADAYISGLFFHVRFDHDVIQMNAGAGKFEVYDTRHPSQTITPLAVRVAPFNDPTTRNHLHSRVDTFAVSDGHSPNHNDYFSRENSRASIGETKNESSPFGAGVGGGGSVFLRRVYGHSDFNYGFTLQPSQVDTPADLPVKFSFVSSAMSNWMTMNVGLDLLDLNINNIELVSLVAEYISCYFRFPEFGHPGVMAFDKLEESFVPYGGVDTRLFITRPHISMVKSPLRSNSQALFLETEKGVYFRYILDTYNSVRMTLNLFDLAAVLVKKYRPPSVSRGVRGSSGSGRGVRTLIEFLNLAFSYHFSAVTNHIDMKVDLYNPIHPDDEEEDEFGPSAAREETKDNWTGWPGHHSNRSHAQYVDLDKENISLEPATIAHPHCVYPLHQSTTEFTTNSCDIVTCYEDVLFCSQLVTDFLGGSGSKRRTERKQRYSTAKYKKKQAEKQAAQQAASTSESAATAVSATDVATPSIFSVISMTGIRVMVVDNVLGLHLPLVQLYLEDIQCNFDKDRDDGKDRPSSTTTTDLSGGMLSHARHRPASSRLTRANTFDVSSIAGLNPLASPLNLLDSTETAAVVSVNDPQHVMVFGKVSLWAEYFNNMKKCWEPLVEKLVGTVLYETSPTRGQGLTVRTTSDLHMNISGAFFRMLNDALRTMQIHADHSDSEGVASAAGGAGAHGDKAGSGGNDGDDNSHQSDSQLDNFIMFGLSDQYHLTMNYPRAVTFSSTVPAHPLALGANAQHQLTLPGVRANQLGKMHRQKSVTKLRKNRRGSAFNFDSNGIENTQSNLVAMQNIDHIPSYPLSSTFRVGFSIQNLTGQPVRYLQQWEGGKKTVQYINNNERGLLNFVASTTLIRNNQIVEETFDVQMERQNSTRSRNKKKIVGNRVALQVSGYRWLHSVQVDELGVHYDDLHSVLGRINVSQIYLDWNISNALKLMTEVIPYCGGRMLRLRSVFTIKNNTRHKIKILAKDGAASSSFSNEYEESSKRFGDAFRVSDEDNVPFMLDAGDNFYVPIALLQRSALLSSGKSLGVLSLCPADLTPVEDELGARPYVQPGSVDYTTDPINLVKTVVASMNSENYHESPSTQGLGDFNPMMGSSKRHHAEEEAAAGTTMQLTCHVNPRLKNQRRGPNTSSDDAHYNRKRSASVDYEGAANVSHKLPPFCYSIEVQRSQASELKRSVRNNKPRLAVPSGINLGGLFGGRDEAYSRMAEQAPVHFTITIHPPIVLENLLPTGGIFELVHATQKRVLWSSWIAAGTAKPVHTVTLDEPLLLLINLKYCRTSEGSLIHQPNKGVDNSDGLAGKIQKTLEGFLDEGDGDDVSSVILTDTVGQRLRVNIENTVGGGGQRHVAVYCPYWIVNTSQFMFRIREEGSTVLPAGTVTLQKDGTRPVPLSSSAIADMNLHSEYDITAAPGSNSNFGGNTAGDHYAPSGAARKKSKKSGASGQQKPYLEEGAVFPGCYGQLHSVHNRELSAESPLRNLFQELTFKDQVDLAYMFNYLEGASLLSNRNVKVQLDDCDWSKPFSLDSVGVNQVMSVDHPRRGILELGFKISVAPGRLAKYTKILRLLPRFIVVNKLSMGLSVIQPTGFTGETTETDVSANHIRPYHLPEMFGERKIALQVDGPYMRTVAFDIDQIGVFTMEVKRKVDLAAIQHVNTRGAPEYTVILPGNMKSMGIYFETDWGEENIVVKALQAGSFAAQETDIQIGDVLLAVDGLEVTGQQFDIALTMLKGRLQTQESCVITLRTVEEKIRLIRESAMEISNKSKSKRRSKAVSVSGAAAKMPRNSVMGVISRSNSERNAVTGASERSHNSKDREAVQSSQSQQSTHHNNSASLVESIMLRVELRQVESSVSIIVSEHSVESNTDYKIENRSVCHLLHYKQKGVVGNSWRTLNPGQCCVYVWEDPFKPHKLQVLAGDNILCPSDHCNASATALSSDFGDKGKNFFTTVNFDEIGYKETVSIARSDAKIIATVKSEGPFKILLITPSLDNQHLTRELRYCTEFINEQLFNLQEFSDRLSDLVQAIGRYSGTRHEGGPTLDMIEQQFPLILNKLRARQMQLIEVDNNLQPVKPYNSQPHASAGNGDSAKVVTDLSSYKLFERPLAAGISCTHQLMVEVLEGKDLTPFVVGKAEDIYCKVFLKSDDLTVQADHRFRQSHCTYVCDQNMDPSWIGQRFVLNVPPKAATESRGFSLRVIVKSKSLVGLDASLGKADIQFSCLKDEVAVEGWFPLRPTRANHVYVYNISGSVKLRLQWVHSDVGYANYLIKEIHTRQQQLGLQLTVQRFAMRQLIKQQQNKGELLSRAKNEKDYYELFSTLAKREQSMGANKRYRRNTIIKEQLDQAILRDSVSLPGPVPAIEDVSTELAKYRTQKTSGKLRGNLRNSSTDLDDKGVDFGSSQPRLVTPKRQTFSPETELIGYASPPDYRGARSGSNKQQVQSDPLRDSMDALDSTPVINSQNIDDLINVLPPAAYHESSFGLERNRSARQLNLRRDRSDSITNAVSSLRETLNSVSLHDLYLANWVSATNQHELIHDHISTFMTRPDEILRQNTTFKSRFEEECNRSFVHVHTQSGTLEITPMQALHLPENKNFMVVRVSYGEETHTSFSMAPAAYLTWFQDLSLDSGNNDFFDNNGNGEGIPYGGAGKKDYTKMLNESLVSRFQVDTLNIKGLVRVRVMSEDFPKAREIARLEIPVFNLLDCTCQLDANSYYDRWFPLMVTNESIPSEGEMSKFSQSSMAEQMEYPKFGYQPCIRLRVRWISDAVTRNVDGSKLYARFQLPSFSLGVIDSEHAREVMQITISGTEIRHAITTDYTDSSLNITWMQVDNQLPDPVSSVIVSPTRVKYPQPVVRLHVRKKNLLSQPNLTSYETIQLVVQELDLRLEQQTVVASWEMIKTWLQERKHSGASGDKNAADDPAHSTAIDSLGFATCTELVQYELLPTLMSNFASGSNKSVGHENRAPHDHLHSSAGSDIHTGDAAVLDQQEEDVHKLYIEKFKIFPIKFNVSFITTPQIIFAAKKGQGAAHSDIRANGTMGLYSSISLFMWQVGEVVLDLTSTISDAPIFFNGFEAPHMFKRDTDVAKILQEHYLHSALGQLYKIVGSLELVGNPIGLLSSLGVGVRDFFYEPAHALITTPTEIHKIGRGVVKGAVSLVSNTAVGFLGTGITITRSIGRGVAKLSMDNSYIRAREILQRPPKTMKAAILRPAKDLGAGFYYGAVGMVKVPYYNVRRYGAVGLIPGIAKGLVGVAANPVVGVLDAVAHSGDAFRDLVKIANREHVEPVQRVRLSDLFGPDGRILPYNFAISLGTKILHVLDRNKAEKINVGNAIHGGMGMLVAVKGLFSGSQSHNISMAKGSRKYSTGGSSLANPVANKRDSISANRRDSLSGNRARRDSLSSVSDGNRPQPTSRPASMVVRMNRFSFRSGADSVDMTGPGEDGSVPVDEATLLSEDATGPGDKNEYVVYTAIIHLATESGKEQKSLFTSAAQKKMLGLGKDLVVILSTTRVVVTEYHRRTQGAYLKKQWESKLSRLTAPVFEKSGAGGAILLLRSADSDSVTYNTSSQSQQQSRFTASQLHAVGSDNTQSVFEVKGAYDEEEVLQNLCNCIYTLRGTFEDIVSIPIADTSLSPSGGAAQNTIACIEDDLGIVHIGPWQFVKDELTAGDVNAQLGLENQVIIKELEFEKWMFDPVSATSGNSASFSPSHNSNNNAVNAFATSPGWLLQEQQASIDSHSHIRDIYTECKTFEAEYLRNPRGHAIYKIAIEELFKGKISYAEFQSSTHLADTLGDERSQAQYDGSEEARKYSIGTSLTGSSSATTPKKIKSKKSSLGRRSLLYFGYGHSNSSSEQVTAPEPSPLSRRSSQAAYPDDMKPPGGPPQSPNSRLNSWTKSIKGTVHSLAGGLSPHPHDSTAPVDSSQATNHVEDGVQQTGRFSPIAEGNEKTSEDGEAKKSSARPTRRHGSLGGSTSSAADEEEDSLEDNATILSAISTLVPFSTGSSPRSPRGTMTSGHDDFQEEKRSGDLDTSGHDDNSTASSHTVVRAKPVPSVVTDGSAEANNISQLTMGSPVGAVTNNRGSNGNNGDISGGADDNKIFFKSKKSALKLLFSPILTAESGSPLSQDHEEPFFAHSPGHSPSAAANSRYLSELDSELKNSDAATIANTTTNASSSSNNITAPETETAEATEASMLHDDLMAADVSFSYADLQPQRETDAQYNLFESEPLLDPAVEGANGFHRSLSIGSRRNSGTAGPSVEDEEQEEVMSTPLFHNPMYIERRNSKLKNGLSSNNVLEKDDSLQSNLRKASAGASHFRRSTGTANGILSRQSTPNGASGGQHSVSFHSSADKVPPSHATQAHHTPQRASMATADEAVESPATLSLLMARLDRLEALLSRAIDGGVIGSAAATPHSTPVRASEAEQPSVLDTANSTSVHKSGAETSVMETGTQDSADNSYFLLPQESDKVDEVNGDDQQPSSQSQHDEMLYDSIYGSALHNDFHEHQSNEDNVSDQDIEDTEEEEEENEAVTSSVAVLVVREIAAEELVGNPFGEIILRTGSVSPMPTTTHKTVKSNDNNSINNGNGTASVRNGELKLQSPRPLQPEDREEKQEEEQDESVLLEIAAIVNELVEAVIHTAESSETETKEPHPLTPQQERELGIVSRAIQSMERRIQSVGMSSPIFSSPRVQSKVRNSNSSNSSNTSSSIAHDSEGGEGGSGHLEMDTSAADLNLSSDLNYADLCNVSALDAAHDINAYYHIAVGGNEAEDDLESEHNEHNEHRAQGEQL